MPSSKSRTANQEKRRSAGRRRDDQVGATLRQPSRQAQDGVSFRVRRLEPAVAWALAGLTLWLNMVFANTETAFWLVALFAASVGGWSRMFPARSPTMMALRAALLIAMALALQLEIGDGAATGPYLLLPTLAAFFYALLLPTRWSLAVLAWLALCFAAGAALTLNGMPWRPILVYTGLWVLFIALANVFGRVLRESDASLESKLRDDRTQLYNDQGFFAHGAVLLAECRSRHRPLSMVLLNGADLLDIPDLLGRRVANELFSKVVYRLASLSGEGIAARTDTAEFGLILPGVGPQRAAALVEQLLGTPPQVELQLPSRARADAKPVTILLDMGVAQATDPLQGIEELYDGLHAQWKSKLASGKAGSEPKRLPVLGPDDTKPAALHTQKPTVPMPLHPSKRT